MGMYVVNTDILNIRSSPSADSDDNYVGFLRKGEKIWLEDNTVTGSIPADSSSNQWRIFGENYVLDEWVEKLGIDLPTKVLADWNKQLLNIPDAWKQTKGRGIKVAVLDTGMDMSHPNLQGIDVIDVTGSGKEDIAGHGTAIAGIIGARPNANYNYGIFGVAPECTLLPIKIAPDVDKLYKINIIKGLNEALKLHPHVLNLSWSIPEDGDIKSKINELIEQSILIVCAADEGWKIIDNSDARHITRFPADMAGTIGVASGNTALIQTYHNNLKPYVNVIEGHMARWTCAPASKNWFVNSLKGSSYACAFISGIAATMLSSGLKKDEILEKLKQVKVNHNSPDLGKTETFSYYAT